MLGFTIRKTSICSIKGSSQGTTYSKWESHRKIIKKNSRFGQKGAMFIRKDKKVWGLHGCKEESTSNRAAVIG